MLLGLRPEHILPEAREGASLTLLVRELEPLGPEQLLIGEVAGTRVVAKLPAHYPAKLDQPATLGVDTAKLHLFARDGGAALSDGSS